MSVRGEAGATRGIRDARCVKGWGRSRLTRVFGPSRPVSLLRTIPYVYDNFTSIETEETIPFARSSARRGLLPPFTGKAGCIQSGQTVDRSGTAPSSPQGRPKKNPPLTY